MPHLSMRVLVQRNGDITTLPSLLPRRMHPILAERREHLSNMQVVFGVSTSDENVVKNGVLIILCQFKVIITVNDKRNNHQFKQHHRPLKRRTTQLGQRTPQDQSHQNIATWNRCHLLSVTRCPLPQQSPPQQSQLES